ncbi:hypothetical protein C7M84_005158 [Penaeus vannamei]|uniref:Uncharacterized protein n=1 Tax=Penaeus vannamei TaxID=6689 RepID=A0A423TIH8_PENVA|nr:hypothetical protein C7M84_005158 [Penaeus vannamei]
MSDGSLDDFFEEASEDSEKSNEDCSCKSGEEDQAAYKDDSEPYNSTSESENESPQNSWSEKTVDSVSEEVENETDMHNEEKNKSDTEDSNNQYPDDASRSDELELLQMSQSNISSSSSSPSKGSRVRPQSARSPMKVLISAVQGPPSTSTSDEPLRDDLLLQLLFVCVRDSLVSLLETLSSSSAPRRDTPSLSSTNLSPAKSEPPSASPLLVRKSPIHAAVRSRDASPRAQESAPQQRDLQLSTSCKGINSVLSSKEQSSRVSSGVSSASRPRSAAARPRIMDRGSPLHKLPRHRPLGNYARSLKMLGVKMPSPTHKASRTPRSASSQSWQSEGKLHTRVTRRSTSLEDVSRAIPQVKNPGSLNALTPYPLAYPPHTLNQSHTHCLPSPLIPKTQKPYPLPTPPSLKPKAIPHCLPPPPLNPKPYPLNPKPKAIPTCLPLPPIPKPKAIPTAYPPPPYLNQSHTHCLPYPPYPKPKTIPTAYHPSYPKPQSIPTAYHPSYPKPKAIPTAPPPYLKPKAIPTAYLPLPYPNPKPYPLPLPPYPKAIPTASPPSSHPLYEVQRATLSQAVYEEWYFKRCRQIRSQRVKAKDKQREEERTKEMGGDWGKAGLGLHVSRTEENRRDREAKESKTRGSRTEDERRTREAGEEAGGGHVFCRLEENEMAEQGENLKKVYQDSEGAKSIMLRRQLERSSEALEAYERWLEEVEDRRPARVYENARTSVLARARSPWWPGGSRNSLLGC